MKMSYKEFVEKYNGQLCDYDGAYGYQCVDLSRACADYVLGHPTGRFGGSANNGFANTAGTFDDNYVKVEEGSRYQEGDICFFHLNGTIGHVGIVNSDDGGSKVSVFDQNTGSGNGDGTGNNKCRIHDYTRKQLKGAWRCKSYVPTGSTATTPIVPPTAKEVSAIEGVWLRMPVEKRLYKDYSSKEPIGAGECRMLVDLAFHNKKL